MCFPTHETHFPSDMRSSPWETRIPNDMCSPTWKTHRGIPCDMFFPTQETHIPSDTFIIKEIKGDVKNQP